nr:HIRAN domain-containing protein [Gammaproteobacteria bacterium]
MRLVKENVAIAGVSWNERGVDARNFVLGQHQELQLRREPDNEWGCNAIAVIGIWSNGKGRSKAQLGYVPEDLAAEVALQYGHSVSLYAALRAHSPPGS